MFGSRAVSAGTLADNSQGAISQPKRTFYEQGSFLDPPWPLEMSGKNTNYKIAKEGGGF